MALNTAIRWCKHTWNPWQGCHRISAECDNCYMYRDKERYGQDPKIVHRSSDVTFNAPLSKKYELGDTVFICSWSDFFHKQADTWRADAFAVMRRRPDLRYIIVTKRIERAEECWPGDWGDGWRNVAVLVTAGLQETADEWIPQLLKTRAAIRGVSVEPLLGPVDLSAYICQDGLACAKAPWLLSHYCPDNRLDWIIVGGESGPHARPMHPQWARDLRDQCRTADVPFFFKQWGEWRPAEFNDDWIREFEPDRVYMLEPMPQPPLLRVGVKKAGFLLDGVDHSAYPKAWAA